MNTCLILGAALSAIAALLHIGCIVFGGPWYRFFGAGEKMASMAESGQWWPHMITAVIALILFIWAGYALSGAGVFTQWPLMKSALTLP